MPPLHQDIVTDVSLVASFLPNQLGDEESPRTLNDMEHVDHVSMGASSSHRDRDKKSCGRMNGSSPRLPKDGSTSKSSLSTRSAPSSTKKRTRPVNHANIASRYLYKVWFKLTLPVVLLSFMLTKAITVLVLATVLPITFAMFQGFAHMINYRLRYADAPVPRAPSHGVVKCTSLRKESNNPSSESLSPSDDGMESPLRLLLIGDSLAVGVGQSSSCTPIMPDVIAKELSKELGGRPVMWTCHGTPGATTGWIIRELEKSMKNGFFQHQQPQTETDKFQHYSTISSAGRIDMMDSYTTTSDDSSCDSIDSSLYRHDEDLQTWQRRLKQQRIEFDPKSLARFDIAVVLTGSNDLKNACFPFLVKDEDSKGVSKRAGDYGKELQRLLKALDRRMRRQMRTLQESVRAAKEKVRAAKERVQESMDTVVDRTLGRDSSLRRVTSESNIDDLEDIHLADLHSLSCSSSEDEESSSEADFRNETTRLLHMEESSEIVRRSFFPMVVLPGMPANALPAFDAFPLRHLAHPMVAIMDGHKRNISNQHDGEVLFVDPPTKADISEYSQKKGFYWSQQVDDNVLLSACDISQRRKQTMENGMNEYYEQCQTTFECNPPKAYQHFTAFSADGIHPNDKGYSFWGRYLGNAIVKEWRKK